MGIFQRKNTQHISHKTAFQVSQEDINHLFAMAYIDANHQIREVNQLFLDTFSSTPSNLIGKDVSVIQISLNGLDTESDYWKTRLSSEMTSECIQISISDDKFILGRIKIIPQSGGHFIVMIDTIDQKDNVITNLKESNHLFLELIKNTPDIICFKDGKGRWLLANDASLKLFQLTNIDYIGKTDRELAEKAYPTYKPALLTCEETDERCWAQAKISRGDEEIVLPNGEKKTIDIFKIPIFHSDGRRKSLILLGRDVTDRRQLETELIVAKEKAEESDRLKSNFLASMSHELRTPLNAVIGFSNLIYEEEDVDEIHEFSRIINNNSNMLLNLIEDLFDISLIESQQLKLQLGKFDIVHTIKEVFEIFPVEMDMLNKLNIELKLSVQHTQLLVKGDVFRTKQILTNLIRNALKFTKEGSIVVELIEETEEVSINVIDTGIGISVDKLQDIFDKFKQVEEGSTRSFGGAGLGLFISKNLALMMGGDIIVNTQPGKGSVFSLKLPKEQ